MKPFASICLALLCWLLPASRSSAAVVSWGFSGIVTELYNQSNALPASITLGMPYSGVITYDTTGVEGNDSNLSPSKGDYYFKTNFSITVHIGDLTFSSTNQFPESTFAGVNIGDDMAGSYDALTYWTSGGVLLNGAPLPPSISEGGIDIVLNDYSKSSFTSDALPKSVPNLSSYSNPTFDVTAYAQGAEFSYFYIGGEITEISPLPKVILTAMPLAGSQLRLSWPKASSGLTLQFATSLTAQNWTTEPTAVVDTATEHTVTVSTVGQPRFFRLVKLP